MITETQTYGAQRFITNEAREKTAVNLEVVLGHSAFLKARAEGWEPIDQPTYQWHQYSESDLMLEPPGVPMHVGDWRLRCWFHVVKAGAR